MRSLIVGKGQVGSGLYNVISPFHETFIKDVEDLDVDGIEILHICIPNSDQFVAIVNEYIRKYKPLITVNHASVPVGTTEKLNGRVCYSPIRGKHPHLDKGIKTFDKFIAGDPEDVKIVDNYFKQCGLKTVTYDKSYMRSLEFCKLLSNIRYGYEIAFMQEAERIAKEVGANIETFKLFETSYNEGYKELGEEYMIRPVLYGGLIGGHCVIQCTEILGSQRPSEMFDWIFFSNNKKNHGL